MQLQGQGQVCERNFPRALSHFLSDELQVADGLPWWRLSRVGIFFFGGKPPFPGSHEFVSTPSFASNWAGQPRFGVVSRRKANTGPVTRERSPNHGAQATTTNEAAATMLASLPTPWASLSGCRIANKGLLSRLTNTRQVRLISPLRTAAPLHSDAGGARQHRGWRQALRRAD